MLRFLFTHNFSLHCSLLFPQSIFAYPPALAQHPSCPSFVLAPVFCPLASPMRLKRSRPSFAPLPLDNDSAPLHSTDLCLRPPSTWLLPTSPCAPFLPDDNSMALDSTALYLRPFFHPTTLQLSVQWLSPCALLLPGGSQRLLVPLFRPTTPCTPLFDYGAANSRPTSHASTFTFVLPVLHSHSTELPASMLHPRHGERGLERSVAERNDSAPFLHDRMFPFLCFLLVHLSSLVSFSLSSLTTSFP